MNKTTPLTTRRQFLKTSAFAGGIIAAPSILPGNLFAGTNSDTLKVGLVGCGGRGTGAAAQALKADVNVILTAVGDVFPDKIETALNSLRGDKDKAGKPLGDRIKVTSENTFTGLDAYQKVIDSGVDVVLLASPPGFRPAHLAAAVKAGKHIFSEKPVATDVPGVRSVMESVRLAREKKLSIVSGFVWRFEPGRREFFQRIHSGAIGDVLSLYSTFLTAPVKPMRPASERPADMSDVEWQVRNWYNFVWLSGDGLVEQAVHSVDKIAWAMKDQPPIKAMAVGGRQAPNHQGNIYDHTFVVYEFPNEVRAFLGQRQIAGCSSDTSDQVVGSTGFGKITAAQGPFIRGKESWRYRGEKINPYQQQHNELFAAIRKGEPVNYGDQMTNSTMMGILGRMAAYTGQEVTWEDAINSQQRLVPENLDWKMKLDIAPMAMPGVTKLG